MLLFSFSQLRSIRDQPRQDATNLGRAPISTQVRCYSSLCNCIHKSLGWVHSTKSLKIQIDHHMLVPWISFSYTSSSPIWGSAVAYLLSEPCEHHIEYQHSMTWYKLSLMATFQLSSRISDPAPLVQAQIYNTSWQDNTHHQKICLQSVPTCSRILLHANEVKLSTNDRDEIASITRFLM